MLVVDIFGRLDGNTSPLYPALNVFGNFMIFLLSPVLPSLWMAYVHLQVFGEERKTKRLLYPLGAVNVINAGILFVSQNFGWYYYIDSNNVYHRGPLFLLPAFITILQVLAALTITVLNRKRLETKKFLSLMFFAVPPFISIIVQICIYGISLMLNSVVLSLLIIFLNIQSNSMYTDYLTGLNNRKKFDLYLKDKINSNAGGKGFSAILIDIDNFKYINDIYGHDIGDKALETAAKLLKSCLRTNDFISRFGGDEICIVLDISEASTLESLILRINNCLEKYNTPGRHPFHLGFSMGYDVYDPHLSAEQFIRHVDQLMYAAKKANKNQPEDT
jgi:diguanylate cyclase (GGDEF)-like protein